MKVRWQLPREHFAGAVADNGPVHISDDQTQEGIRPSVSVLRLIASLLLAGLTCGVIVGAAYLSLLLFALLEAGGIPLTACLAAALLINAERRTVTRITGWHPPVPWLILAALPGTAVALGLRELFDWNSWLEIWVVVAAGLVVQAVVLFHLSPERGQHASPGPAAGAQPAGRSVAPPLPRP